MYRRRAGALVGTSLAVSLAGCVGLGGAREVTRTDESTFSSETVTSVAIETIIGDITVVGMDRSTLALEAEIRASTDDDLNDTQLLEIIEGDHLRLVAETDEVDNSFFGFQTRPNPAIHVDLSVPTSTVVSELHSTVGEVRAEGVTGPITVDTTTGGIELIDITGSVDVESTTGAITVQDIDGNVDAEATTGSLKLSNINGTVHAETTTGSIDIEDVAGDVTASTTTGNLDIDGVEGRVSTD